jgi:transposase
MRDRWASYDRYGCRHSICGAHVVRDLTYEYEQQGWASELKDVLLGMHAAACQWRERGAARLPTLERDDWVIPRVAQRDEGKQADEKPLPVEERDSGELEQIRAIFPSER